MTNLPEPNFIDRDAETIVNEWVNLYEEKSGKTLQPAQIERLMIDVGAYRETVLRMAIQETAKQNLLSYANIDNLEYIAELLDVRKLLSSAAVTTLSFYVDSALSFDFTIQSGVEVETNDGLFIFKTNDAVVLSAGQISVSVKATCEKVGKSANNYAIGTINNLITPLSYITKVENITVSDGGADDEEADSFRERIRQAPEKFSNAGSLGAYKYYTLSANQLITDVAITSPSAGIVNIYPLTSDGNPTQEIIDMVQEYLSDEKLRPLTDLVQVISPDRLDFTITATIYLYKDSDQETVLNTIEEQLTEYKSTLSKNLGKNVIRTQIIALLNSVYGVFKVDLNMENDIDVKQNQWANLESWQINIGGYADE